MRRQTLWRMLLAAAFLVLMPWVAQADWEQVGEAGFSAGQADYTSLALDGSGRPYVAYTDSVNGGKVSVMRFNGAAWEQVGAAGFSAGQVAWISLALDSSGRPHVAYTDSANGSKASVMRFNGTAWEQVGAAGFSAEVALCPSLAIDSSGRPYVAYVPRIYVDDGISWWWNNDKAKVMRFNGTNWEQVGAAVSPGPADWWTSLALDSSGRPHLAYMDYYYSWSTGRKASVMRFNGTGWEQVGAAGFSPSYVWHLSIVLDNGDIPYVAYMDGANDWKASVMRFNGTNWEQVGAAGFSPGQADYTRIAIDSSGRPYVAYMDEANDYKASVMRFNGTAWEQVGTAGFSAGSADYTSLALDGSGRPYVAYMDGANDYKASVMRLAPTNQAPVAEAGPDQAVVQFGATVLIDGSQSWDNEGDPLTYSWSFASKPAGSNAVFSDPAAVKPTFQVDKYGAYTIKLTVSDGKASSTDQLLVSFANIAPVANAGQNQSAVQGETLCFDGSGSADANGDPLTYAWTLTAPVGSTAVLNDPSAEKPCITADLPGTYTVSLTVNDGTVDSTSSTAKVVAISYRDALTEVLQQAITAVNALDTAVLNNTNNQKALTNQINTALALIDQGSYADALAQLQSTLGKTDGCAAAAHAPDKNDWCKDCASQATVYPLLQEAIGYLESMK